MLVPFVTIVNECLRQRQQTNYHRVIPGNLCVYVYCTAFDDGCFASAVMGIFCSELKA